MMEKKRAGIEHSAVGDIPAIILRAGAYTAAICPEMGANCFLLEHGDASLLRRPPSFAMFRENPNVFGLPLLFPPNRIKGGKFSFQGRTYSLPVNEPARGHHIHGFLSSTIFDAVGEEVDGGPGQGIGGSPNSVSCFSFSRGSTKGSDDDSVSRTDYSSCRVSFSFEATKEAPYSTFPHAFRVALTYTLDARDGLGQRLEVENRSDSDMPFGLGFHTAFNCPFLPETRAEDYRLRLPVSREILLDRESIIPTGESVRGNALIAALTGEGIPPQGRSLSNHFSGAGTSPREAVLIHIPSGRSIVYRVDPRFAFWTLWNQGGDRAFVCPEPQTWMIDAPNSELSPEESGFRSLAPGESISLYSTIRATAAREEKT